LKTLTLAASRSQTRAESAALVVGFSILMGLLARVSVPLPFTPVPVTGQTLGVLLAGAVLGGPRAAAAMMLYLAQGLAGLPVFSTAGPGGPAQLLGPTGGYLLSYPLAAFLVGYLAERWQAMPGGVASRQAMPGGVASRQAMPGGVASRQAMPGGVASRKLRLLPALLCGEGVIFAMGAAWLGALSRQSAAAVLQAAVWPFLPGEILKVALVLALAAAWGVRRAETERDPGETRPSEPRP